MPSDRPAPPPRRTGFTVLAVCTTGLTLLLVAVGGAVRATDSGLACPTWPGCFSAGDFLPALQLNVWLEHSHRLLAGVVGVLVATQLVWAVARTPRRRDVVVPAAVALVAVVVQAALGALVVLHLLRAELVTAHLGMAMLVVACMITVAVHASTPAPVAGAPTQATARRVARTSAVVAGLTLLQILVGGHVTGTGGGLVFAGDRFPLLGLATLGPVTSEAAAFNVVHRVLAAVLVAAVAVLVVQARSAGVRGWLLRLPQVAAGLLGLQILLGVANLASGLSFLSVIPHLAVASWLWAVLVTCTLLARRAGQAAPAVAAARAAGRGERVGAA